MSIATFTYTGTGDITQPSASGKLILVSSGADTGNVYVVGEVSGVSTTETVALTGTKEIQTTNTFDGSGISVLSYAGTLVGTLTIQGQGTAAIGYFPFVTVPANGDTAVAGLTGFTRTYTFRHPARDKIVCGAGTTLATTGDADWIQIDNPDGKSYALIFDIQAAAEVTGITCVADVAGSLDGKYFVIYDGSGSVGVWIDVDDSGTSAPAGALACTRQIEVTGVVTNDTATAVATAVASALDADAAFGATSTDADVTVTDASNGERTNAADGDAGFTFSVTKQGATGTTTPTTGCDVDVIANIETNHTATEVATTAKTALNNDTDFATASVAEQDDPADADLYIQAFGYLGAQTLTDNGTGFTLTEVYAGTDAANVVRTGYKATSGVAATTSDVAGYLSGAINATGTEGVTMGTGTTVHADLSASSSTSNVTVTDRLACGRGLSWACAVTGTWGTAINPTNGVDGDAVAALTGTNPAAYEDVSLDTEDLATDTLPGLLTGATDEVFTDGKAMTLWLGAENVASAIALKYQLSNDNDNWHDGALSITNLDNNVVVVSPSERAQYVRLNITSNSNTTPSAVNAKVVYG